MKVKSKKAPEAPPSRPMSAVGEHPHLKTVTTRAIAVTTNTDGMRTAPSNKEAFGMGHRSATEARVSPRAHGAAVGDHGNMDPVATDRDFINRRKKR